MNFNTIYVQYKVPNADPENPMLMSSDMRENQVTDYKEETNDNALTRIFNYGKINITHLKIKTSPRRGLKAVRLENDPLCETLVPFILIYVYEY